MENTVSAFRSGSDAFIGNSINIKEFHLTRQGSMPAKRQESQFHGAIGPRVLVIADSEERLCNIKSILHAANAEITSAKSSEELRSVCREPHDIAIVDISSTQLQDTLGMIRANADHARIPLLVVYDRLIKEKGLAGVLPKYRAMPCSPSEMAALVNSRTISKSEVRAASLIL